MIPVDEVRGGDRSTPREPADAPDAAVPPADADAEAVASPGIAIADGRAVRLDPIEDALEALAAGQAIIVVDDEDRENEGDLIFAAASATAALTGFMIRYTSGYICVGMDGADLDRLNLPPMTAVNEDRKGTAYTVTVDARAVRSTGISAEDRAITIRTLADSACEAGDLTRPGHVMPLRAVPGGVLRRPGHTEAAVDLTRLAGMSPAGALCEMVNDDGTMMNAADCRRFADEHGLVLVSIADLIRYRRRTESLVTRAATTTLPTEHGAFVMHGFISQLDGSEHAALVMGDIGDGEDVLVRVHAECVAGDVLGSTRCRCGQRLRESLRAVAAAGRGVVLYMRPQEGQQTSLASAGTGHVEDHRERTGDALDYGTGSQILTDLGVRSMRLLTAHPRRHYALEGYGLRITEAVPLD